MQKFKQIILTILCVSLLVGFGCFAIYRSLQYDQHKAQVFGHSFGISSQLYATRLSSAVSVSKDYCITDDGILCVPDYTAEDVSLLQIGELIPFHLSESNFDLCLVGADWCAYDVDAAFIRSHTHSAWKCVSENGELYYLILQENGDVFLATGEVTESITISEIRCLDRLDTE